MNFLKRVCVFCLLSLPLMGCGAGDGSAVDLEESVDEATDSLKNDVEDICEDANKEEC